jgi:hypothetical protein
VDRVALEELEEGGDLNIAGGNTTYENYQGNRDDIRDASTNLFTNEVK